MIHVDEDSGIPLFGLDFIGILDRGTNLLEIKPITVCNLRCKYCFVNAHYGNSKHKQFLNQVSRGNDFMVESDYIIKWLQYALDQKKCDDVEIHIAPYGEYFLYPKHIELIKAIKKFPQVRVISIQTNGTLLNSQKIQQLEDAGVTRLNISINALNPERARTLSGISSYNVSEMQHILKEILHSKIELLIAPIWFFKYNDEDIIEIIHLAKNFKNQGFKSSYPPLGIQNYLVYKTGRKFWKVEPRTFQYFYSKLTELEKLFDIKLKLGPLDFGIHPTNPITPPVEVGSKVSVQVICQGRSNIEYIGALNDVWAVKILSKIPLAPHKTVTVSIIKQKLKENLITAKFEGTF